MHISASEYTSVVKEARLFLPVHRHPADSGLRHRGCGPPGGCKHNRATYIHRRSEFYYILSGSRDYQIQIEIIQLHQGDTIYFDAPRPHGTINRSAKPVVLPVVIFRSPRTLSKNCFIMSNNQEPFLISAQESKIPKSFIPQKNDHKVFERGSKKSLRFGAFNSEEKAVS